MIGVHLIIDGPHNPGWTGFVIIDTSHISIHTFDVGCKVSMDAFSCRPFEKEFALKYIKSKIDFLPESMNVKFVERKTA